MTTTPPEPVEPALEVPSGGDDADGTRAGRWWRALGTALSVFALTLVVGIALAAVIVPRVAGATTLAVLTGSM